MTEYREFHQAIKEGGVAAAALQGNFRALSLRLAGLKQAHLDLRARHDALEAKIEAIALTTHEQRTMDIILRGVTP